ncbi:MAG: RsmB/NOP family class I SAM-dependent RNA methyltransferase [Betaproteobacteria bacterium]|nr:RsmB/NOP family class I SAM-dependent RNA methyltransferase [Betaproteobacteria bacterium]
MTTPARPPLRKGPKRAPTEPAAIGPDLGPAIEALERVLDFSRPADVQLSGFFRDAAKLGQRERNFIAELVFGVVRRLRTLQALVERPTPRRLALAWLARYGGWNLRQFEGVVKDSAWLLAVKSADANTLPEAVRLELPDWLHERLAAQYGERLPALAEALARPAPLDLRANDIKMDRDAVLTALRAEGIAVDPTPYAPLGLRMAGKPALQRHPLFIDGAIEVQDEGSQLLGLLLAPKRGEMVCDFCAGAGGKTLALGAMMRNTGRLYAYDVTEKRLANLKPRLARSGLSNVHPQLLTDERDPKLKRLAGKFDRVLVDAPCSGLGTLRRNPDLKWRQSPESVAELTVKQAAILDSAARMVRPGGRLVYATCSLLSEENEAIVEAFLAAHAEFRLLPAGEALAAQRVALEMGDYLRLGPDQHNTDGFFAAVLERGA